jgi:7-cyano-7-deazaguanine synthase in queuosine biosynthesis
MDNMILFSGGLDSFIAYYYLNRPRGLFINLKHKYVDREWKTVQKLAPLMEMDLIIDDQTFDLNKFEMEDSIIPLRNVYFALLATNYDARSIYMIGVYGDWTHDKNPEAFSKMSDFLTHFCGKPIKVDSPFWDMTKTDMVQWYKEQNLPIDLLLETYSCFLGEDKHCGHCPSCFRRWIAFYNNDIEETYLNHPLDWEMIPTYFERMIQGRYPVKRKHEFTRALLKAGYEVPKTLIQDLEENQ